MCLDEIIRIIDVRGFCGSFDVLCEWRPSDTILEASRGTELHLSSHTLDPDGKVLIFDGPRARPGPEPDHCVVLPVIVPDECSRCRIAIEPVVETRFWASGQGFKPKVLDVRSQSDGSVCVTDVSGDKQYRIPAVTEPFSIPGPLFGLGDSERCIEIPWVLSRCAGALRVLDIGHANAESRYVKARNHLRFPFATGLDVARSFQDGIAGVAGDVLQPPFAGATFDLILAVSVIEHIGRHNEVYFDRTTPLDTDGDFKTARMLGRLLSPNGRMLVTVPFGAYEDHGWFVQYDRARLDRLIVETGCLPRSVEFYCRSGEAWSGPVDPDLLKKVRYRLEEHSAGSVACLELIRVV